MWVCIAGDMKEGNPDPQEGHNGEVSGSQALQIQKSAPDTCPKSAADHLSLSLSFYFLSFFSSQLLPPFIFRLYPRQRGLTELTGLLYLIHKVLLYNQT